jgi:hypothetical protein
MFVFSTVNIPYLCSFAVLKQLLYYTIMRKIVHSLAFIAIALGLHSCNDKLNIAAPYKNITVVYGLLDMSDTAHYIRIEKAFMDENKSALDMAKVADSSFYAALTVSMKELRSDGTVNNSYSLYRVDLTNEGYPKDTGTFFATPSYAYKFTQTINPLYQYRLIVKNNTTGEIDSANSPVIDNSGPYTSFGVREWLNSGMKIDFSHTGKYALSFTSSIPANVGITQLILRFRWVDSSISTHSSTKHTADYTIPYTSTSSITDFSTLNTTIYDYLNATLGAPATTDNYRYFDSSDMILYAAGTEYEKYSRLNQNQGGLTADEIRPIYTNIKGANVLGLFSTRASISKLKIPFSEATKDSIAINASTKDLHIKFK